MTGLLFEAVLAFVALSGIVALLIPIVAARYAAGMMVVFPPRGWLFEEPWLAESHGEPWQAYKAGVTRWIGWRRDGATGTHQTR